MMIEKCQVCMATGQLKPDLFYNQMLCVIDWERRKADAIANRHSEWLEANGRPKELEELERGDYLI